jgi:hypothetical protein
MPTVIDHIIQGSVLDGDKVDFAKEKLAVQAFVKGQEVAHADVDASGRYKLTFKSGEERPTTELRVAKAGEREENLALTEITPTQFVMEGNQISVQRNLTIPGDILRPPFPFNRVFSIVGHVFAHIGHTIVPQAGLKLDLFTFLPSVQLQVVNPATDPPLVRPVVTWRKLHGSTAFTDVEGSYTGFFGFETSLLPPLRPLPDPYFMVEISQFVNGIWNKVYSENISLAAVEQDNHFDFLVPGSQLVLSPICPRPDVGLRFGSIGLIPCDTEHLVKGYASTKVGEPLPGLTHRPFCGQLRIFGLFAQIPQVPKYKVEIALTDENHVPDPGANLKWETLADPLQNLRWNSIKRTWDLQSLGPDPATSLYQNIDVEPEAAWLEHSLKFVWNSANKPDGFYAIRITAFDANNNPVLVNGEPLVTEMPVLRIDNTVPQAELLAPDALPCGKVVSANGKLNFKITAYDPAGHVLTWGIRALAGRDGFVLNDNPNDPGTPLQVEFNPPLNTGAPGIGVTALTGETVTVLQLPPELQGCDPLVYNFELIVYGSATNGYPGTEQYIRKDVSLMVSKS